MYSNVILKTKYHVVKNKKNILRYCTFSVTISDEEKDSSFNTFLHLNTYMIKMGYLMKASLDKLQTYLLFAKWLQDNGLGDELMNSHILKKK